MNPIQPFHACIALAMLSSNSLRAQEDPSPEIAGLQQAASDFVLAYNNKDASAIAELFTENAEITGIKGDIRASGRAEIKATYAEALSSADAPSVAIEVDSVRLVGKDLAIEDGTVHFTPPGDNAPARSTSYTAVLQKTGNDGWRIASTRDLGDATDAAGQLANLAEALKGDWTAQKDGMRLDFAFGWDGSGKFIAGEMLATAPDAEPQTTTLRIGWDAARKTITWWSFDDGGGFAKGDWTPVDGGWLIRTEGTTADGEVSSANQTLKLEGKDTLIWTAAGRLVDGQELPDVEMRIVRQTPEPAAE